MKIKSYNVKEVGTGQITKEYAEQTFQELLAFQGYGFCKAHATSYAVYSAVQLWLQEHYFLEYMCALLTHIDRAKQKKGHSILNERVEYCIKHGTGICYPDVNISGDKWVIKSGSLVAPIKNIKGFSDNDVEIIEKNRPYHSLKQFLDKTEFNNKKFETLLFANAFSEFGTVEDQYNWYYNHYCKKEQENKKTEDLFSFFEDNTETTQEENIVTFSKIELMDKCMDLNGFIIPINIQMKYNDIYKKHIKDLNKSTEDTRIGNSKIYPLKELLTMKKGENSNEVWSLVEVRDVKKDIKSQWGKSYNKLTFGDGETTITLSTSKELPSLIKRGLIAVLPFNVRTDEQNQEKENKIYLSFQTLDKIDVPIIEVIQ